MALFVTAPAYGQTYSEKVLYKFTGIPDGIGPEGGLVRDAQGNLYGLTVNGGSGSCPPQPGCGTVFKLDPSGNETVLHSFLSGTDGALPTTTTLIQDAQGNLYGTTFVGGAISGPPPAPLADGTVFKVDASGNESVLFAFQASAQGLEPQAGLVRDSQGNLYGVTFVGGIPCTLQGAPTDCGTVFKLDPTGKETVLYNFTGTNGDGARPGGSLVLDSQGNLYGVTSNGGNSCPANGVQYGCGTVFKIDSSGKETVLYSFTSSNNDGMLPEGGLVFDAQGNLYGTTNLGGSGNCGSTRPGCGTVYKIDPEGKETVLHRFNGTDGAFPNAGLLLDSQGNLYGTTFAGGGTSCQLNGIVIGCGTVFKLDPSANETVVYRFAGSASDGFFPDASTLIQDSAGNLYGTALGGGASNYGLVFEIQVTPPGFSLGSASSISINRGATTNNTVTIPVNPSGGFSGSVALSAAITSSPAGAQQLPTFSFGSTSPVNITSGASGTAILTISTFAATGAVASPPARLPMRWYAASAMVPVVCVLLLFLPRRTLRRGQSGLLLLALLLVGGLPACGGGSGSPAPGGGTTGTPGTTPGAYTVKVTASSGSITATQTITLTVQ